MRVSLLRRLTMTEKRSVLPSGDHTGGLLGKPLIDSPRLGVRLLRLKNVTLRDKVAMPICPDSVRKARRVESGDQEKASPWWVGGVQIARELPPTGLTISSVAGSSAAGP